MTNKLSYIITLLIIVFIICLCNEYLCNYSQMNTFRISTTENNSSSPISKFRSAVRKVININKLRGKKFEQLDPPLKEDLEYVNSISLVFYFSQLLLFQCSSPFLL